MLRRVLKEGGICAEVRQVVIEDLRLNFGWRNMASAHAVDRVTYFLDNNISFSSNSLPIQVTLHSLPRSLLVTDSSFVNDPAYHLYVRNSLRISIITEGVGVKVTPLPTPY